MANVLKKGYSEGINTDMFNGFLRMKIKEEERKQISVNKPKVCKIQKKIRKNYWPQLKVVLFHRRDGRRVNVLII